VNKGALGCVSRYIKVLKWRLGWGQGMRSRGDVRESKNVVGHIGGFGVEIFVVSRNGLGRVRINSIDGGTDVEISMDAWKCIWIYSSINCQFINKHRTSDTRYRTQ